MDRRSGGSEPIGSCALQATNRFFALGGAGPEYLGRRAIAGSGNRCNGRGFCV